MGDLSLLAWIWLASCGLALVSVVIMLALILKRVVYGFFLVRDRRRRGVLEGILIEALDNPDSIGSLRFSRRDLLMLGDIGIELSGSIRGETQKTMVGILARLGVDKVYAAAVSANDSATRDRAVTGLALFDSDIGFDALWEALKDPELAIRMRAAHKIVEGDRSFDATAFINNLGVGTDVRSRELRPILAKLAKRDADGVRKALSKASNEDRKLFLIYAMGQSGRFDLAFELMPLTMSENTDERAEAIRALGALGNPDCNLAVILAMDDPSWEVRAQAAQAAGRIGLPRAIPRLAEMLNEKEWWVRYRAAWALWQLGKEGRARLTPAKLPSERAINIAELVIAEAAEGRS